MKMAALSNKTVMQVYLITYSQADIERFNRESFARAVTRAFEAVATAIIVQWHVAWSSIRMKASTFKCVFF